MTNWEDVKLKIISLDYKGEEYLNKILQSQDCDFGVSNIQMAIDKNHIAYIFYWGIFPTSDDLQLELSGPKPQPRPKPSSPFGTLPEGLRIDKNTGRAIDE